MQQTKNIPKCPQNIPNWPQNTPNGHEAYQMFVKYSEWPQNMPNLYIPRHSKTYPIGILGLKIYHLATLCVPPVGQISVTGHM
jgi:hypothetical protein